MKDPTDAETADLFYDDLPPAWLCAQMHPAFLPLFNEEPREETAIEETLRIAGLD